MEDDEANTPLRYKFSVFATNPRALIKVGFGKSPPSGSRRARGATRQSRWLSNEWLQNLGPDAIEIAASSFASAKVNGKVAEGEKYVF